jgi:hypothetical protein
MKLMEAHRRARKCSTRRFQTRRRLPLKRLWTWMKKTKMMRITSQIQAKPKTRIWILRMLPRRKPILRIRAESSRMNRMRSSLYSSLRSRDTSGMLEDG